MTSRARRRGGEEYQNPTLLKAVGVLRVDALSPVLEDMKSDAYADASNRRLNLEIALLVHGLRIPVHKVATRMNLHPEWVRRRASRGISTLRHPSLSQRLYDYVYDPQYLLPSPLIQSLAATWKEDIPAAECLECGDTLTVPSTRDGRRRLYCSSRCRQAAYRARKRLGTTHKGSRN